MSAIRTYNGGRLTAQEHADLVWGVVPLPQADAPSPSNLCRYLAYRNAQRQPQAQHRIFTDPLYWRRRAAEQGTQPACSMCGDSGEVIVPGIFGEYEGAEPCWVCKRLYPVFDQPVDDTPF